MSRPETIKIKDQLWKIIIKMHCPHELGYTDNRDCPNITCEEHWEKVLGEQKDG